MPLDWGDIVIDKRAVRADAAGLMKEWLWLAPKDSEPMLLTACGDMFLRLSGGSIAFLDTYAGTRETVAPSYERWKAMLNDPHRLVAWFRHGLIGDLHEAGLSREPGQCFSPLVPQIINGSWEATNFHACDLLVHLVTLGQIHCQVKNLPPGTRIAGFEIVEE